MKVGLETVVSYFPDTIAKREDFSYLDATIPPGMETMLRGPDEIRRLRDENALEILAENVVKKALDSAKLSAKDIDFIVAASLGGKHVLPMVGTYVHHKLGFPAQTPVINIQNFCASFVDGMHLAWNLILGGNYKKILVVAVTAVTAGGFGVDLTSPMGKLVGDGAGAGIVSTENLKCEFLSYYNETMGELYDHMVVDLLPVMHPELKGIAGVQADMGNFFIVDEWFFAWMEKVGKSFATGIIKKALEKEHLTLTDVDRIVIHQVDNTVQQLWMKGGEEIGVSRDKWKETWSRHGNIGNVDIAANLVELWESGEIKKGSILAFFAPGAGGHTPCMITRWLV